MPKSLVIVESDAKSKTINRFLGKSYMVKASVGHIKNLPKNRLGVDIENGFEPEYITIRGRGKILKDLKRLAAGSDQVFIATDPDREGEAIAFHLAEEIRETNPRIRRVLFHEITEHAVKEAIENPMDIDQDKVEAQKARRVMDRIVGYKVSPFLWKTVFRGLSAGRVQSVALRLICEREEAILKFKADEYWSLEAILETENRETFRSKLVRYEGEPVQIPDEKEAGRLMDQLRPLEYVVSDRKTKEMERHPYAPYTTSTLQQDGARRLGMSTSRIMAIAQQLYEGIELPEGRVGLITYMRTDSTRVAQSAVQEVRQWIADNVGLEYVPALPRMYKNKKRVQDAHEAIRPTTMQKPPREISSYLNPGQKKLYEMIWNRFIASQMASARLLQTVLEVTAGAYLFRTMGSSMLFRGFMQIYDVQKESEENVFIPQNAKKGDRVLLVDFDPQQHFTKPPVRYNESSLVKELDNKGIGRPSTYALIISTLLDRKYVERADRNLKVTELGIAVNSILTSQFPDIVNVSFTAQMEAELDQIESGEKKHRQVLENFYVPFSHAIEHAMDKKEEIKESLQEERKDRCPKCDRELVVKWGRNGRFVACTGYPECKYTRPLEEETQFVEDQCAKCNAPMVVKLGRYGRFLACSNYPECKFTKPFSTGVSCPEPDCKGQIIERKSRRGRVFYGCSAYPACKFASWYKPVNTACPACGHRYMEEKVSKTRGTSVQCPSCKAVLRQEEKAVEE